MPSQQQMNYYKKSKGHSSNVSAESYADSIFRHAFEAPFTALEQGQNNLASAFETVVMAAYVQEKIVNGWGKLSDEDLLDGSPYRVELEAEKARLDADDSLSKENRKSMLAYFKLTLILKKIVIGKGKAEEFEV